MTRPPVDRLDRCLQHCADLSIDVEWSHRLPRGRRGQYQCSLNRITLDYRLTRAQATAALAHELGHAVFGDLCSTPAIERRAWQFGAPLIISAEEYARAEELVGPEVNALACELEVTVQLIEAWRAWWNRCGRLKDQGDNRGDESLRLV